MNEPSDKETVALHTMRMRHIGACALLGRISGHRLSEDENDLIKRALEECAELNPGLEVWNTHGGGASLEPKP